MEPVFSQTLAAFRRLQRDVYDWAWWCRKCRFQAVAFAGLLSADAFLTFPHSYYSWVAIVSIKGWCTDQS